MPAGVTTTCAGGEAEVCNCRTRHQLFPLTADWPITGCHRHTWKVATPKVSRFKTVDLYLTQTHTFFFFFFFVVCVCIYILLLLLTGLHFFIFVLFICIDDNANIVGTKLPLAFRISSCKASLSLTLSINREAFSICSDDNNFARTELPLAL